MGADAAEDPNSPGDTMEGAKAEQGGIVSEDPKLAAPEELPAANGEASWWDTGSSWLADAAQAVSDAGTAVSTAVTSTSTLASPDELAGFAFLAGRPAERDFMLRLRDRAGCDPERPVRACEAPNNAMEKGLNSLRKWAESCAWPMPEGSCEEPSPWGDVSPRWKRLGFQSQNPRTDLRTGILALECLLYICEHRSAEAWQMIKEAGDDALNYPFAVASINVTQMLAWYLSLYAGPNPAGPESAVVPLTDKEKLGALAQLSCESVFEELHCASLARVHLAWQRKKTADPSLNVFAFAGSLEEALAVVDETLQKQPLQSIAELRQISDAPAPVGWLSSIGSSLGVI